ncbi:hypothetical protein ACH5RR_029763, partial [Cinchona calisaya]
MFHFSFSCEEDLNRVISNRPWILDNQLLVLHNLEPNIEKNEHALLFSHFLVQVWNLPLHCFSKEAGYTERICRLRGITMRDNDEPEYGSWLKATNNGKAQEPS